MSQIVLFAEGDQQTRFLMKEIAFELCFEAELANDGMGCLRAIQDNPGRYALIIMDMNIPNDHSFEAINMIKRALSESGKTVPMVCTTTDTRETLVRAWKSLGVDMVLQKPYSIEKISEVLSCFGIDHGGLDRCGGSIVLEC